jgi:hypothetical protein
VLLPTFFITILVLVKNSYEATVQNEGVKIPGGGVIYPGDPFVPQPEHAFQPMTFQDTVTALRARKLCKWVVEDNPNNQTGHFEITGIHNRSQNWQIPYLRCDSRQCRYVGQDAAPFCEVSLLALAGSDRDGARRADAFRQWLRQRYPALREDTAGGETTTPAAKMLRLFDPDPEDEYNNEYSNETTSIQRLRTFPGLRENPGNTQNIHGRRLSRQ